VDKKTNNREAPAPESPELAPVLPKNYTDGRPRWDWETRYATARAAINYEAWVLGIALLVFLVLSALAIALADHDIKLPVPGLAYFGLSSAATGAPVVFDCRILSVFFSGCVGGTTFSIKWLIHAVAKGTWHLDRRYWRFFVPFVGGVYAVVVLTLFDIGIMGGQVSQPPRSLASVAVFGFLTGYFSDGVSGLLTNIAGAVFGTLKEK